MNNQACNKVSSMTKIAWNKLQEYYNKTSESYYYISTILDPYCSLHSSISSFVSNNLQNEDNNEDLLFLVSKHFCNHDGHDELNAYLDSFSEPSIPTTSASVEWLFSESGNVVTSE
ncbi:9643_t:CDS:2 [Gigaspora margarita]|uniref:9643_t:CDS:1 n=1 Tax=Gigaspora margarita TaxID=4874 RepID=A0ABN7V7T2_GIGMA|nr:9643_t:CDS:2 [Gigaspora margarita]